MTSGTPILGLSQLAAVVAQLWSGCQLCLFDYNCKIAPNTMILGLLQLAAVVADLGAAQNI